MNISIRCFVQLFFVAFIVGCTVAVPGHKIDRAIAACGSRGGVHEIKVDRVTCRDGTYLMLRRAEILQQQ